MYLEQLFLTVAAYLAAFLVAAYAIGMIFGKRGVSWVTNHVTKPLLASPFRLLGYVGSSIADGINPKKKKKEGH